MRTLALLLAVLAIAPCQTANVQYPIMGGRYYATSFVWSERVATPVQASGWASVTFPTHVTLERSTSFSPAVVGVPVAVVDGPSSETIVPTNVTCAPDTCTVTAHFSFAHPGGFTATSANYGLNEAIQAARVQGGEVVLGPDWPGTATQIATAAGASAVAVLDERVGGQSWYTWNGTAYVLSVQLSGTGGLSASSPAITPTSIEHVVYADLFPGTDWCAQVHSADLALGSQPGLIIYPSVSGTHACTTQLVLTTARHTLFLEAGNYELNAAGAGKAALVIAADGVSVYGAGIGRTVLSMGPASQDDAIRACGTGPYPAGCTSLHDVTVHDLTINGNQEGTIAFGDDTYQNGVNLNGCARCRVFRTHITDVWAQGVLLGSAQSATYYAGNYTLTGTRLTATSGPAFDASGQWSGLPVLLNGTMAQIASVTSASQLTLAWSTGVAASGTYFVVVNAHSSIDHNIIDQFGEIGAGIEANQNYNTVADNFIGEVKANATFATQVAIFVSASNSQQLHTTVTGNTILNIGAHGTGIYAVDNLNGLRITDNSLSDLNECIAVGTVTAVQPNHDVQGVNNFCSNASGIGISDVEPSMATGSVWKGNRVTNAAASGYAFGNLNAASISNNDASGVASSGGSAFQLNNIAASLISGNRDDSTVSPSFALSGTSSGNQVVNNLSNGVSDLGSSPSAIVNSGTAASWSSSVPLAVTSAGSPQLSIASPDNTHSACVGMNLPGGDWKLCNLTGSGNLTAMSGASTWLSIAPANGAVQIPGPLTVGAGTAVNAIIRASGTLTFPSIAAQTCLEQTIAAPGASPGGTAGASPAASPGALDLSWSAWVSALGTVSVRLCNPSATAITPAAVTWNVEVMQ